MKTCTRCGESKALDQFGVDRRSPDGLTYRCLNCRREYDQQWRHDNRARVNEVASGAARRRRQVSPDRPRELARHQRERYRTAVFDHYGRVCACCGATAKLTIDHVNGGGKKHREQVGRGTAFYRWLIHQGFPDGFQILCLPCNVSKHDGDRCRTAHAAIEEYETFWKEIVENPNGSLNKNQVMRELADYSDLMRRVSEIYGHVTGGRISKPETLASAVIQVHDEYVMEAIERALAEERESRDIITEE